MRTEPANEVDAKSDDAPFPPLWSAQLFAWGMSIATVPVLTIWWGPWENQPEDLQDRHSLAGWLLLGGLVAAWCTYFLTKQRHLNHAAGWFVFSVGLVAASLLVSLT